LCFGRSLGREDNLIFRVSEGYNLDRDGSYFETNPVLQQYFGSNRSEFSLYDDSMASNLRKRMLGKSHRSASVEGPSLEEKILSGYFK